MERLRGYTHRQEWARTDHEFVTSVLREWESQVTTLLQENARVRARNLDLAELNRRNEWRLAGRGFVSYVRFLLGIDACPL